MYSVASVTCPHSGFPFFLGAITDLLPCGKDHIENVSRLPVTNAHMAMANVTVIKIPRLLEVLAQDVH